MNVKFINAFKWAQKESFARFISPWAIPMSQFDSQLVTSAIQLFLKVDEKLK